MKTKRRITNSLIILLNIISLTLIFIPLKKLNLLNENYSTLSLTTRGYLYVLITGIFIGLVLNIETTVIKNRLYGLLINLSMIIGVIVPHHIPYNFQGNLHLLFAYIGFAGLVSLTLINCGIKKYRDIYILFVFVSILIYLKFSMVNTLSEVIVMTSSLLINLFLFIKKENS